jgi:hypothetical protein
MRAINVVRTVANILEREARFRATGRWPAWVWHEVDNRGRGSGGWPEDARKAAENGVFVVMIREIDTAWGRVAHAWIRTASEAPDITWAEKQRIKDELFGRERLAVEVFPPQSEMVDAANLYHIWVLPAGFALPFNLKVAEDTT